MSRRERERALLQLVRSQTLSTQAELVDALEARGFDVTQATVSRDVKRLGLVKLPAADGAARYVAPDAAVPNGSAPVSPLNRGVRHALRSRVLSTSLREFATSVEVGNALLCIRTHNGCANAVAVAIDEAGLEGVVGTLAGDDTIFVLARDTESRDRLRQQLAALLV